MFLVYEHKKLNPLRPLLTAAQAEPIVSKMPPVNLIQQVPSCSSLSNGLSRGLSPTSGILD